MPKPVVWTDEQRASLGLPSKAEKEVPKAKPQRPEPEAPTKTGAYEAPEYEDLGLPPEYAERLRKASGGGKARLAIEPIGQRVGIDVAADVQDLAKLNLAEKHRDRLTENPDQRTPPPELMRQWRQDAVNEERAWFNQGVQLSGGTNWIFIDSDPEGTTNELAEQASLGGLESVAAAVGAWAQPANIKAYKPTEQANSTFREGTLGWLHWLAQGAPSTYLATGAMHGFGTREQIEAIRGGESVFEAAPQAGKGKTGETLRAAAGGPGTALGLASHLYDWGFFGEPEEETSNTLRAMPAIMTIVMLEPDALTLGLGGLGKAARVGSATVAGTKAVLAAGKGTKAAKGLEAAGAVLEGGSAAHVSALAKGDELLQLSARVDKTSAQTDMTAATLERIKSISPTTQAIVGTYLQALTGTAKPAAEGGTIQARLVAAKAHEGVAKIFDKLGIDAKAAANAGVSGQKYGWRQAKAAKRDINAVQKLADSELEAARALDMMNKMALDDAKAMRGFLKRMPGTVAGGSGDVATARKAVDAALAEVLKAREAYIGAPDPAAAQKTLDLAYNTLAAEMVLLRRASGTAAFKQLDDSVLAAQTAASKSEKRLHAMLLAQAKDKVLAGGSVAGVKKDHAAAVKALGKKVGGAARGPMIKAYTTQALREMGFAYKDLGAALKSGRKVKGAALMAQGAVKGDDLLKLPKAGEGMFTRTFARMRKMLEPPHLSTVGVGSGEFQQVGKGALDQMRLFQAELGQALRRAKTIEDRVEVLHKYVGDATYSGNLSWGGQSFVNMASGESLWASGRSMLRQFSQSKALRENELIQGLSRVYIPGGAVPGTAKYSNKIAKQMEEGVYNLLRFGTAKAPKTSKAREAAELSAATQTFPEFMEKLAELTVLNLSGNMGTLTPAGLQAGTHGLDALSKASQVLGTAAIMRRASRQVSKLADAPPEVVLSMDRIMAGTLSGKEEIASAMRVFGYLGLPITLQKTTTATGKELMYGVHALKDGTFIPRRWMDEMTGRMGPVIKELQAYRAGDIGTEARKGADVALSLLQLWKTNLTTGVLFARPRYFANMLFGNFAQVWAEAGIVTALQNTSHVATGMAFHSLQGLPVVGPKIDKAYAKLFEAHVASGKAGSPQHSLMNALFNPYVGAFYDPKLMPAGKKIADKNGRIYTAAQLREAALSEGVFTSYGSTAILNEAGRGIDGGTVMGAVRQGRFVQAAERHGAKWAELADFAEQRQRVALFLHSVIGEGRSTKEAGALVRNSLYDWGHAVEAESRVLSSVAMYWRFYKLALKQAAGVVLDGAVKSYKGEFGALGLGTKTRRLRDMTMSTQAMAAWDKEFEGEDETDGLRHVFPWWSSNSPRIFYSNNKASDEMYREHLAMYGVEATHVAYSLPGFTPMDMTATGIRIIGGLVAAGGLIAAGATPGVEAPETAKIAAEDGARAVGDMLLGPVGDAMFDLLYPKTRFASPSQRDTSLTRQAVLGAFIEEDAYGENKEGVRVDRGMRTMWDMAPVASEISYWADPALESALTYQEGEAAEVMTYLLRQWLGIGLMTKHDPKKSVLDRQKFVIDPRVRDRKSRYRRKDITREDQRDRVEKFTEGLDK